MPSQGSSARKHAELQLNLLGPEMVRDLVSLIQRGEADETCKSLCSRAPIPTISFLTSTRPLIRRNRAFLAIGLCPVVSSGPVVGGQFDMSTIENNRSWTHFRVDRRNPRYCHDRKRGLRRDCRALASCVLRLSWPARRGHPSHLLQRRALRHARYLRRRGK